MIPILSWGQIGGQFGYQALNVTTNARTAALGGTSVSLADGDISQFFENPATLDSVSGKNLFVNFNPYFAGTFVFNGAYSFNVGNAGTFAAGLNYIGYGDFEMADEAGNSLGVFQAQDYTFSIGKSHRLGPFVLGANLKVAHSSIDVFQSTALLMDIGGIFKVNKNWSVGMVLENMGVRLSSFTDLNSPSLPFDVVLGTTFKPTYMPIRFTVTTNSLVRENEISDDDQQGRSNAAVDQVIQRINVGGEILLNENFQLLIGYNHKRKQELRLTDIGSGAGFFYGLMLKVKRVEFRFSRATFHAAGGTSFISLRTDLDDFKKIL
ncbi:MAG: type IX secretion system protein PorQ [Ekhidna sp.]|nr:type IX secretion system protein PorQ [Ekhidna sp.]